MISGRHVAWTAAVATSGAIALGLLTPAMLRVAAPQALVALALPAAFVTCFAAYRWWRDWTLARLGDATTLSSLARHYDARRANARVGIATAAMVLACVALALFTNSTRSSSTFFFCLDHVMGTPSWPDLFDPHA